MRRFFVVGARAEGCIPGDLAVIGVTIRFPLQNVVIFPYKFHHLRQKILFYLKCLLTTALCIAFSMGYGKVTGGFFPPVGMRPVRLAYVDP